MAVAAAAHGKGIDKLWAHRKITDIEIASTLGEVTPEVANKQVLDVALAHQIVSSQTSLIAVDKTPKRPAGERLTRAEIPLNLPAGWNYDKIFGETPVLAPVKKERDAMLQKEFVQLALAKVPAPAAASPQQVVLPQTATPAALMTLISFFMAGIGTALRIFSSRSASRKV